MDARIATVTLVGDGVRATTGRRSTAPAVGWWGPWLVGAAIAVLWSVVGLARQRTMATGIDLGLYTQAVQGYAHGQWPWAPLKAQGDFNLLGDHFTPVVAVLAPFYRLWPTPGTRVVAQAVLIGIAVVVVARTAVRVLGHVGAGCCVGAAFGLSWGIAGMALFDFHEVAFAVPLLAIAMDRAMAGRWRAAVLWSLPLMVVKEDGAFLVAGLAVACWLVGRRRLAVAAMAFAVGSFALVVGVVVPALSYSGTYTYWAAAGEHHGPVGMTTGMVGNLREAITSGSAPLTVLLALACTGFLALRSPLAAVAVPPLLVRFTSAQPEYWGPNAHYNATLVVIVFMAGLDGWQRHGGSRGAARTAGAVVLVSALVIGWWTPLRSVADPATYRCGERCAAADEALARIPDGATVVVDTYLVDQLVSRTRAHPVAQRLVDSVGHQVHAEWALLDTGDQGTFPTIDEAYWWGGERGPERRVRPRLGIDRRVRPPPPRPGGRAGVPADVRRRGVRGQCPGGRPVHQPARRRHLPHPDGLVHVRGPGTRPPGVPARVRPRCRRLAEPAAPVGEGEVMAWAADSVIGRLRGWRARLGTGAGC